MSETKQYWAPGPPSRADRLLVVLSDIEMGAGGVCDDFPHTDFLGQLILGYNGPGFDRLAVDLVFNGDTFDFLKTAVDGAFPRHVTCEMALQKLQSIAAAHGDFFEAVRQFLSFDWPRRRVHFIYGNHDAELLFPEVQRELARLCGVSERVFFPGFELKIGEVHIEHGSQADEMFRMDPKRPFIERAGERFLNLAWGALAMLEVAVPMHHLIYHLDRVKPRDTLFEIMPEAKEMLIARSWQYWTRDYLAKFWNDDDPMRRISWAMIKEIVYRFATVDTEASIGKHYLRALQTSDHHRLFIVGHRHQAGWWSRGDRKLLQTGCFRNEYILRDGGHRQVPVLKVYAEAYLDGDQLLRSHLVEIDGPPAPEGHVPASVLDFLPAVKELLGSKEERAEVDAERRAHEATEARTSIDEE